MKGLDAPVVFDIVRDHPEVTRTAYQRLYDMILSHGVEETYEQKEKVTRFKFFTEFAAQHGDAIFGLDRQIINLVNTFNPELIVIGGALARASAILIPVIETTVRENALQEPRETVKIAISAYGPEACIVGAAAIVLDEILRYPFP